ncbi:MAG TPA: hypothetical protein VGA99_11785 [bacterium]
MMFLLLGLVGSFDYITLGPEFSHMSLVRDDIDWRGSRRQITAQVHAQV